MSEIRVDNITDEAGTGAPEIVDHYKKSNILGTVSESGGVPTGAIIERGSNANGEFVKYADGTLVCFIRVNLGSTEGLYDRNAVFPASFIDTDYWVHGGGFTTGASRRIGNITFGGGVGTTETTNVDVRAEVFGSASGTNAVKLLISGRWY